MPHVRGEGQLTVTLRVGTRLVLPSGNVIVLLRRERGAWVCEYAAQATRRGEVEFAVAYLRKFGRSA